MSYNLNSIILLIIPNQKNLAENSISLEYRRILCFSCVDMITEHTIVCIKPNKKHKLKTIDALIRTAM